MKAIIVDDSLVIRNIIEKSVSSLGFSTLQAANGKAALEILQEHAAEVQLILLDWNMPVLDGYQTIKGIKARDDCGHICIVMVSTEAEDEKIGQAFEAGADGYLTKPFTEEEFGLTIRKALDRFKCRN